MKKPDVSKVSEVATKTTKSTPAVPSNGTLLTEEQILQMSEKDYMNDAQLAFFKARLQQLERDLLKNAGETTEHLRETVLVPDPADRATIEEEHALVRLVLGQAQVGGRARLDEDVGRRRRRCADTLVS